MRRIYDSAGLDFSGNLGDYNRVHFRTNGSGSGNGGGCKRASSGVGGVAKNQVAQLTWRAFRGLMVIHWRVGTGQG